MSNDNTSPLTGKDDALDRDGKGLAHAVVLKLLEGTEGTEHHVYMDNWYNSPTLFEDLHRRGYDATGTVRTDRRGMPPAMKAAIKKNDMIEAHFGSLMAIKWMDKRPVCLLTTTEDNSTVAKRRKASCAGNIEEVQKPRIIDEYNQYMGGVDKGDQLASYYGFYHRSMKWWRRAFFHLIDVAIVNAYILYCLQKEKEGSKILSHKQFRVELTQELLLEAGLKPEEFNFPAETSHQELTIIRLTERHFITTNIEQPNGRPKQRDCVVCSERKGKGRKTTTYMCKQCTLPMCVVPCFELYHTKVEPQRYL